MWLSVRNGDIELAGRSFDGGTLVVGRDEGCGLVIGDERASRRHARLTSLPGGWVQVEDLGSTNGTWVDGVRIAGPAMVGPGSALRVGGHLITFAVGPPPAAGPPPGFEPAAPPAGSLLAGSAGLPAPPPHPPGIGSGPVLPQRPWPAPPVGSGPGRPGPAGSWRSPPVPPPAGFYPPTGAGGLPPPPAFAPGSAPVGPDGLRTPYPLDPRAFISSRRAAPSPFAQPSGVVPAPRTRRWLPLGGGGLVVAAIILAVLLIVDPFAGSRTYTPAQLSADWGPSTLYVQTNLDGKPYESGSAWVLDASEGLIVTNAHVVDGGTSYETGQGIRQQPATLVGVSPCDDLAVLKIAHTGGLRSFDLGHQSQVQAGDAVTALGYPGGSSKLPNLTLTTGVVSVSRTDFDTPTIDTPDYPDLIETNAQINPGNSGGPLLNDRGQIIGINTATITEQNNRIIQGEGFAIGIDRARTVLRSLAAGRSKGFTGFNFLFVDSSSDFTDLGLPVVPGGIIIPSADPGSPAYEAGFGRGEPLIITAIDNKKLDGDLPSYCNIVGKLGKGQSATFTVESPDGMVSNVKVGFE